MTDIIEVLKDCDKECEKHGIHFGAFDEAIEIIGQIRQRNKELEAAFTAAKGYIDASPCDPDIDNEQIEAYQKYQDALAQLDKEGERQ